MNLGVSLGYRNKKKECLEHDFIPDYTLVHSSGEKFTTIFPQLAMVKICILGYVTISPAFLFSKLVGILLREWTS